MPEAVVDRLEPVEVDEAQPEAPVRLRCHQLGDPFDEHRPVGQPGQRVLPGLAAELALQPVALGDVQDHRKLDLAVPVGPAQAGRGQLGPHRDAGGPGEAQLRAQMHRSGDALGVVGVAQAGGILGMGELVQRPAVHPVRGETEHP